ncbi:aminotransferase class V-fold PLP-dependent enzyme [Aliiglaciecola sp. LCG003]|uniref:aminotransferase class V-fold PLP-dependent enzyme n=1 Tax=Aliiglaciecola sp. LCG003 TaxID=3053655 RepID=UPI0025734F5E|nr:aminotransferase class V-fold PLP-dependent enzyme [Aliiglaciecola sp. LCG003]WJG09628.1 aminotransferase class V-fold PLP-dependent enzyme [Aliiglaciecola sp. LCG003]
MSYNDRFDMPDKPYFLSHSVGCLSKASQCSLAENFLNPWKKSGGEAWHPWMTVIKDFNEALALLFNAKAADFCPQTNLSSGFSKFLLSMPAPSPKRNKVLMHHDAFPSMGFVVKGLQAMGLELLLIDSKYSADDIKSWEQHIDSQILCALVTHVHSNTGIVSPVEDIVKLCRQFDVLAAVDIAQSAGVINIDLTQWSADVVFGSCVKWLCGGPGAGFMWINPDLIGQLNPVDVGWFSHQNPFEMDIEHLQYADNASRFWGGTPSIAPYALALGGVKTILDIGVEQVYAHNRQLLSGLVEVIQPHLISAINLANIGGTLCAQLSDKKLQQVCQNLDHMQCFYDQRGQTIRLSFHIYNSEQDMAVVAQAFG